MYILHAKVDCCLSPHKFGLDLVCVLTNMVNEKYCGRVLQGVGMCYGVYDFLFIGDAVLIPGDGAAHVVIGFRLVILRPFTNQYLLGSVNDEREFPQQRVVGINVGQSFEGDKFPDDSLAVNVAKKRLPQPAKFDSKGGQWLWDPDDDAGLDDGDHGNVDVEKLHIEKDETVLFKCIAVRYCSLEKDAAGNSMAKVTSTDGNNAVNGDEGGFGKILQRGQAAIG